jgi:endonuclease/exonuclease/phosphatase family metal-dependent hydrolase
MRLVTVNLYNGRVLPHDLVRFLDEVAAEVVCAQEVGPDAGRILAERFPYGAVESGLRHEGRAMVSTRPISPTPLELPFRGGYRAMIDIGDEQVDLISVHLGNPAGGIAELMARHRQLDALLPILALPRRRVVAGDLNATPAWPAYRRLRRYLDDGVADLAARRGVRPSRTWSKYARWPALLRIDHVLTRGVEVTSVRVERIAGLDHRALVVDLVV